MKRSAKQLVQEAFRIARSKGKPDWHRMSLAVLKNRLLDITDRKFTESSFGANTFKGFVESLPDLLQIDATTFPPTVELIVQAEPNPTRLPAPPLHQSQHSSGCTVLDSIHDGTRIRPDLWKAVLDWDPSVTYVWDAYERSVRKQAVSDEPANVVPRIGRERFDVLRAAFVTRISTALGEPDRSKLSAWGAHKLPTHSLPSDLVAQWHSVLQNEVESLLQDWLIGQDAVDDTLDKYRGRGDNLAVGELLAQKIPAASPAEIDSLLATIIANWASVRATTVDVPSIRDLIARIDSFPPSQLALALIHSASRLKELGISLPPDANDLAFRTLQPLREVFGLSEKIRPQEVVTAATAKLDEALAGLREAVRGFQRTTSVTAKQPSIEVLRQAHRYGQWCLSSEQPLLRELDTLLGPVFRKFCESCERHDANDVMRRASELRQHLERVQDAYDADVPYAIWSTGLLPSFEHVSSLIEEGMRTTDEFTTPEISIIGGTFKLDLCEADRPRTFPVRLRNEGRGMAYGLRLLATPPDTGARLEVSEPGHPFDLMPKGERLIILSLAVRISCRHLEVPVIWTCATANGKTCEFRQLLTFAQQSSEPDWEALQKNPPYAINPIKERQRLFGRDAVIADLSLLVSANTSTFLWGQKRVGKTSVLQVLASEVSSRNDVTCIILRMGELAALHEGQIAHTILCRIHESLGSDEEAPSEDEFGAGLGRLVPYIDRLSRALPKQKFVVIIDEFDDLDAAFYTGERGRQFVKALRSLSEVGLAFFFVGSERMNAIYQTHVSDLNKWTNFSLDRIESVDDCAALIEKPVKGVIEYDGVAVRNIVRYCAGNPFYTHLLCSQIFRRCVQERRTYVGESDVDDVRRVLLRQLGPTNFAHFWEDNPELLLGDKQRQSAENCLFLTCVASRGGAYESCEDLLEAQQALQLSTKYRLSREDLRKVEVRLLRRRVIGNGGAHSGGFYVELPILRDWIIANAESQLLPMWHRYVDEQASFLAQPRTAGIFEFDTTPFPISEDDLLPVSQKLVYLGRQIDVAEVRRWLRQFDDDNRIEVAFQLLKRLVERGFVSDGAVIAGLSRMQEALNERRTRIGGGAWITVRRRLDNLCITFVDSDAKSGAQTARELAKRMQPGRCAPLADACVWLRSHLEGDPLLVIADDFSGTGGTLLKGLRRLWEYDHEMLSSLADEGRILCCLLTAFPEAVQRLRGEFPRVTVLVMNAFDTDLRAFESEAGIFEDEGDIKFAHDVMLQIGRQLTQQMPLGYGDMAGLVAFHNSVPNNTLPIFWSSGNVNNRPWIPLLPRASF